MGTRYHYAFCKPCADKKCTNKEHNEFWDGDGSFGFMWEHMSKTEALEYLQNIKCPCCGSDEWTLSDYSEI